MECLYPSDNSFRHSKSLNGLWYVCFDETNRGKWETAIPHATSIVVPSALQDSFQEGLKKNWQGDVWYETQTLVDKSWLGQDLFLYFEGIGRSATVYINGTEVGHHEGAYTPFHLDITKYVRYGEKNKIIVKVNTMGTRDQIPVSEMRVLPDGRKVTMADGPVVPLGLHGDVILYTVPTNRIIDINVDTKIDDTHKGVIQYLVHVQGNCLVTATLRDSEGRVIATSVGGNGILTIESPQLWSPSLPYLYTVDFEVSRLGKQCDIYSLPIGIREIEVKEGTLLLNKVPLELKAVQLKRFYQGRLLWDMLGLMQHVLMLKQTGANCLFTGGYPAPVELLKIADRVGLLIINEIPAFGLKAGYCEKPVASFTTASEIKTPLLRNHVDTMKGLIQRDKEHPSIIGWVIVQQPERLQKEDEEYMQLALEYARKFDFQKRPMGMRIQQAVGEISEGSLAIADFLVLTQWIKDEYFDLDEAYQVMYHGLVEWQAKYPQKMLLLEAAGDISSNYCGSQTEAEDVLKNILKLVETMPNIKGLLIQRLTRNIKPLLTNRWQ